ncbi:MAG: LysM peptidoglycan-binding domain-containing protein [Pseudomonadota bacterium]|nr:LysM peptidoglycan-binding domain-containing protein [Pseudomonadota bacterium]
MLVTRPEHFCLRRWPLPLVWMVVAVFLTWMYPAGQSAADHLVQHHKLKCSQYFPCPDALRRRVDFWIDVYGRWRTNDAILHDAQMPHRVYKIIKGKVCGTNGNTQFIKEQKRQIRLRLERIAILIERKKTITQAKDKHYLNMFPGRSPAALRRAARNLRCQSGNKDGFRNALRRFGTYGPIVRRVLKDAGLHQDIQYLPFVESSYNPEAYSRVGAAGMWQIMPRTARVLGLELNATMDERLDPEAASWAAARYLKDSRKNLTVAARSKKANVSDSELTPFVITSYNYGVNGMRRAIKKLGPDFLTVLNRYRTKKFRVAVKNFYAGFLAARHVARNSSRFFGSYSKGRPLRYDTIMLRKSASIDRIRAVFGISLSRLKSLNPALTRFVWHGWREIPGGYPLRLPLRQGGWADKIAYLHSLPPEADRGTPKRYTVRPGDTACAISSAFRVKCRDLIDMNRLGRQAVIRVGQSIQIPMGTSGKRRLLSRADPGVYTVAPGDTVCGVAQRYGVKCRALLAANGLTSGSVLSVGRRLVIPGALAETRGGDTYTVRKGDSACGVASRYGVSCDTLLAANELSQQDLIYPGQTLRIPRQLNTATGTGRQQSSTRKTLKTTVVVYRVKQGDSACRIAARLGVSCEALLTDNRLGRRSVIHPGQKLLVSGVSEDVAKALGPNRRGPASSGSIYTVTAGDSVCEIAHNRGVSCDELLAFNGLQMASIIVPGQALRLPANARNHRSWSTTSGAGVSKLISTDDSDSTKVSSKQDQPDKASAVSSEVVTPPSRVIGPLDQDIEFRIQATEQAGKRVYRINIEPGETLGHYSDWLRLGGIAAIRKLNGIQKTQNLQVGDVLLLPVSEQTQVSAFDQRRLEYHRVLVEEFKENFEVLNVQQYTIQPGDSVWRVASSFELPVWLIMRYNPELRTTLPIAGNILRIPSIRKRSN